MLIAIKKNLLFYCPQTLFLQNKHFLFPNISYDSALLPFNVWFKGFMITLITKCVMYLTDGPWCILFRPNTSQSCSAFNIWSTHKYAQQHKTLTLMVYKTKFTFMWRIFKRKNIGHRKQFITCEVHRRETHCYYKVRYRKSLFYVYPWKRWR